MSENHDDEATLGERGVVVFVEHRKVVPHRFREWPRIHLRYDGVLLRWVKVVRLPHQSVEVGLAVSRLYLELLGSFPTIGIELAHVAFLQHFELLAVSVPHDDGRRLAHGAVVVYDDFAVGAHKRLVLGVFGCQQLQPLAIEPDPV